MELNLDLIHQLRRMAAEGASVRMMITEIRKHTETDDGLCLVADHYFWKAFLLPLGEVRDIEGSLALGGKAYTDEQIDKLMLPRIARARHLWERE